MVWETWVMVLLYLVIGSAVGAKGWQSTSCLRIIRLTRLIRVTRASKITQAFPEIMFLIHGIIAGIRSVLAILCLLSIMIYIFALFFTLALRDKGVAQGVFDHIPSSMNVLMIQVLCGADSDLFSQLLDYHWAYYLLFILFVVLANLCVLNLLIGILCDAVADVAEDAKDRVFLEEVQHQIERLTSKLDVNHDGTISSAEFEVMISDPYMVASFDAIGVDLVGVADFARFVYSQVDAMSYPAFTELVSRYRGTKQASIKHISSLMRYMSIELVNLEAHLESRLPSWL